MNATAQGKIKFWALRKSRPGSNIVPGTPSVDDLQLPAKYEGQLRQAQIASGKTGLILGATRQTVDWCRSRNLRITLMDFSKPCAEIIRSAHPDWEGLRIIIDDWLSTAESDGSFCWAAGDGVVAALGSGRDAARFFQQLHRLLLPGSLAILRSFVRPFPTPSGTEILNRLKSGEIRSFSAFRIQFAHSFQRSFMDGVPTRDIYEAIVETGILDNNPEKRFSWTADQLAALDYWMIEGVRFCYPTLAELSELARPYLEEIDIGYGNYEAAALFPTIIYKNR